MADDDTTQTDEGFEPAPVTEGSAADDILSGGPRRRRRPPRSWSTTGQTERFDRPLTDTTWGWQTNPTPAPAPASGSRAPIPPPPQPDLPPRPGAAPIGPVLAPSPPSAPAEEAPSLATLLTELREEFGQLRDALTAARTERGDDGAIVSGKELAAVIEGLGISLGNGMATLLSDHRALLARDIEAGSDRVLEEVGRRLRTTTNQVIDGVEAKVRHVNAQSQASLADQFDARLDQLQNDLSGLRAVMLEIPDQTELLTRFDLVADGVAELNAERARDAVSGRVAPALLAALEEALAPTVDRIEQQVADALEAQRRTNVGELDGEDIAPDAEGLGKLTREVVALRRRIGLRAEARQVDLTDEQLDAIADRVVAKLQGGPARKAPAKAEATPAAKKAPTKAAAKAAARKPAKRAGRLSAD